MGQTFFRRRDAGGLSARAAGGDNWQESLAGRAVHLLLRVVRSHGLPLVLLVWLALAALSGWQKLGWLDNLLYDAVLQVTPATTRTPQVLLVEAHYADIAAREPNWAQLSQQWLAGGAQRVAFGFPLPSAQEAQLRPWLASGKVVTLAAHDSVTATQGQLQAQLQESGLRGQWWARAAGRAANTRIWADYAFPVALLPSISLPRAEQEGVIPALLQNKVVLVGFAPDPLLRNIRLPGTAQAVTQLRHDGLQVDSLLQQAAITQGGPLARMLGTGAFAVLLLLLLQRASFKFGLALLVASSALCGGLCVLLLWRAQFWLPLPELLLLATAVFVAVFYAKIHADDLKIRELIRTTSGKLHKLALPPSIFQTQDHWHFILRLIDQTLHVQRVIILEKTQDSDFLREVSALGCDIATIAELRRDYQRAPYSTAIASRTLLEVPDFLAHAAPGERQFVLPLLLGGELLGFLAFGVQEAQLAHFHEQQAALTPMATQIANLLYQRRLWLAAERHNNLPWQRWFEDGNAGAFKKLTHGVAMMEQRLAILEQTFSQASHAKIVYDLFGRVLLANTQMSQRLAHSGVNVQGLTATDFVARLSGRPLEEARLAMQTLILERTRFSWPVNLPDLVDDHLVLRASVLDQDAAAGHSGGAEAAASVDSHALPFNIGGVLVEVMDVSEIMLQHDARSEIRMQAAHYLHEDLQKLPALLRALAHDKLTASMSKRIIAMLQHKAHGISAIMEKSRLLLEDQVSNQALCYPVDVAQVLQKTVQEITPQLQRKNLQFDLQLGALSAHGFAVPRDLKFCFNAILRLLILDASSDSLITVHGSENGSGLMLNFANDGYGISNQRLQHSLEQAASRAESPLFADAHEAMQTVAQWGGCLRFHSEIGEGMQARLNLAPFWWRESNAESQLLAQIEQARQQNGHHAGPSPRQPAPQSDASDLPSSLPMNPPLQRKAPRLAVVK